MFSNPIFCNPAISRRLYTVSCVRCDQPIQVNLPVLNASSWLCNSPSSVITERYWILASFNKRYRRRHTLWPGLPDTPFTCSTIADSWTRATSQPPAFDGVHTLQQIVVDQSRRHRGIPSSNEERSRRDADRLTTTTLSPV